MPSSIVPQPERSAAKSNGRTMPMQRLLATVALTAFVLVAAGAVEEIDV